MSFAMRQRMPELPVELLVASALFLVVGGGTVIEVRYAPYPTPAPAGAYAIAVLSCLVLVLRRRFPVTVTIAGLTVASMPCSAAGVAPA